MSRQLIDLEQVLSQLVIEHRKLLKQTDVQQAAMKALDTAAMDAALALQEGTRLRIASLENRRRLLVQQIGAAARVGGEMTVQRLAELYPQQGAKLLALRDELKGVILQVTQRNHVVGRLSGAVLGHLNTAMRILTSAVQRTGLYTKNGAPRVTARLGVMDAVG